LTRQLKENKKYPSGWRVRKRGARAKYVIWFKPPPSARHLWGDKTELKIGEGNTLLAAEQAAYTIWAARMASDERPYTLSQLFNRYTLTVLPKKKTSQRESNAYSLARLTAVMPLDMPVTEFKPHHAFQYRDGILQSHSVSCANKDLETLSHVFTKGIEWGCDLRHPIKGTVQKLATTPSTRYVTDDELAWFLSTANPFLRVYCPLKLATGKDQIALLKLKLSDISKLGINFERRQKTNVGLTFLPFNHQGQSTGLKELIDAILVWRASYLKPGISSVYLFCSKAGKPMFNAAGKTSAFKSQWKRAMDKALDETELTVRFTEHNLRAKTASDLDDAEAAQKLLQHSSVSTTKKVYIRTPQTVLPLHRKLPTT
jgi:integrase